MTNIIILDHYRQPKPQPLLDYSPIRWGELNTDFNQDQAYSNRSILLRLEARLNKIIKLVDELAGL